MNFLNFLKGLLGGGAPRRKHVSTETAEKIRRDWQKIETLRAGKLPSQLRQALITADKTLDNALRDLVEGEKMGERLKNSKPLYEYSVYDNIWKAHKLRNKVVHETDFEPPHFIVEEAIEQLRVGLEALGIRV